MSTRNIPTPEQLLREVISQFGPVIEVELWHLPAELGYFSDIVDAIRYEMPKVDSWVPYSAETDDEIAEEFLSEVYDAAHESDLVDVIAEGGGELIYTADCVKFYERNMDYCDDTVEEFGGIREMDLQSVSEAVATAGAWGADRMWREYCTDAVDILQGIIEGVESELSELLASRPDAS